MNSKLLKAQIIMCGKKMNDVANELGISKTAFYRKLKGETEFTRHEIEVIINYLGLTIEKAVDIFFGEKVA